MAKKTTRSKRTVPGVPQRAEDSRSTPQDLSAKLGECIRSAAPDIVNALIDEAKKGNSTPAKFLFDFAGLHSAAAPENQTEDSLAALLLRELARSSDGESETPGTIQ